MLRGPSQPIVYLVDALEARRMLWLFCMACGHSHRTHPHTLARRGGGLQTLEQAAGKCRCRRCGSRDAMVFPSLMNFDGRG